MLYLFEDPRYDMISGGAGSLSRGENGYGPQLIINTERLILRMFQDTDYDDLYEYLKQPENDEFEGYPGITYENGREHRTYRVGSDEFYAIELKETGRVICNTDCGKRDFDAREVGYIIN